MGISPPLRTTLADGDSGHEADHGAIATFLNNLFTLTSATPAAIAATGAVGTATSAARADHVHAGASIGTATPLQDSKTPAAGSSGFASDQGHVHPTRHAMPSDNGLLAWSGPTNVIDNTSVVSPSGNIIAARLKAGGGFTLASVWGGATAAGTTLTNCYICVYSLAGVRLGISAEMSANLMSGTIVNGRAWTITPDVAGSLTFNAGDEFLVGLLVNGTGTGPSWWRTGSNNSAQNVNLSAPNHRFMSIPTTPATTPPTNIATALASATPASAYWFAAA
jgi:hypothetical protein